MRFDEIPQFIVEMYQDLNEKKLWELYLNERTVMMFSGESLMSFEEYKKKMQPKRNNNPTNADRRSIELEALKAEKEALDLLENI